MAEKSGRRRGGPGSEPPEDGLAEEELPEEELSLVQLLTSLTEGMARWVAGTGAAGAVGVGRALLGEPSAVRREAGAYVRELRELAGLTLVEVSEALDLRDRSLVKAVEEGTATLSFELILRLAAIVARHDPVPFVARMTRTYNPALWKLLEDWGIGRVPVQLERERKFVNVYRSRDQARRLSEEGFERVLDFTRAAFDSALHFASEQENAAAAPRSRARKKPRS